MMIKYWLIVTALNLLPPVCLQRVSSSLWANIEASSLPISKFRALIVTAKATGVLDKTDCSKANCRTLFVPNDTAMEITFPGTQLTSMSSKNASDILLHHITTASDRNGNALKGLTSQWPQFSRQSSGFGDGNLGVGNFQQLPEILGGYLYWYRDESKNPTNFLINNAKIDKADNEAANGCFHVISAVLLPMGAGSAVHAYMSSNKDLSTTLANYDALYKDADIIMINKWIKGVTAFDVPMSTFFLPSNEAWQMVPSKALTGLTTNLVQLKQVMMTQLLTQKVIFPQWFTIAPVTIQLGTDSSIVAGSVFSSNSQLSLVHAGGVTSKVMVANIPVKNGVVHIIDRPLNFLYQNVVQILKKYASNFYNKCNAVPSCAQKLTKTNVTVLAPKSIPNWSTYSNTEKEAILALHVVPNERIGRIKMSLKNSYTIPGVGIVRFRVLGPDILAEGRFNETNTSKLDGGYVASKIVTYDIPATDGMVQVLETVLGIPTQTLQQFIEATPDLSILSSYLTPEFVPNLGSPVRYTVFAVKNSGFQSMTDNDPNVGGKILTTPSLRTRLLRRMIISGDIIIEDFSLSKPMIMVTTSNSEEDEKLSIAYDVQGGIPYGAIYGMRQNIRFDLRTGALELTNGILYFIDEALYVSSDKLGRLDTFSYHLTPPLLTIATCISTYYTLYIT